MIIRKAEAHVVVSTDSHGGAGTIRCTEMLADYTKDGPGFKYIHDNTLEPGASIGEHTHHGDEELYIIISGRGTMKVDGVEHPVGPGDMCVTRDSHSHDLTADSGSKMRMLVVCTNL